MAVADDALAEIFDVALLVLQQGAPRGFRPRLVPAIDRPLGRLRAVVVPQRLPAQSISRIARQISGHVSLCHFISEITQPMSSHAGPRSASAVLRRASETRVNALVAHASYASVRPLRCARAVAISCSPSAPTPSCSASPTTTAMA